MHVAVTHKKIDAFSEAEKNDDKSTNNCLELRSKMPK